MKDQTLNNTPYVSKYPLLKYLRSLEYLIRNHYKDYLEQGQLQLGMHFIRSIIELIDKKYFEKFNFTVNVSLGDVPCICIISDSSNTIDLFELTVGEDRIARFNPILSGDMQYTLPFISEKKATFSELIDLIGFIESSLDSAF